MIKQENYPLTNWLLDLRDVVSKREYIEKKTALLLIVEEIDPILEYYEEGHKPQFVYSDYFKEE